LFGELSPAQLKIIKDRDSKYIVVAAGPGSGKTRLLVHKLASLLLMEDVKHEQLLMLTFSRAAVTEFKKRLLKLIGNAANFVEIKTFHSYCFDLLGKVGDIEKSDEIIRTTIEKIKSGDVEPNRITKTVLVIDEAQDMDADEYELISVLAGLNDDMRIIAVGDDDQNIYEFRGSSSKYIEYFITEKDAVKYELTENYRSSRNLVEFTNQFVLKIKNRLKTDPIISYRKENGKIKIVKHTSRQLITPLVNDILQTGLSGSTCVLTQTNDEALQIAGALIKKGFYAKLIQTNESFSLYNLYEIRYFLYCLNLKDDVFVISDDKWARAKSDLTKKFSRSTKLEICINLIKDFELSNPQKKYKSDLEVFIRESKLEDFITGSIDTIIVSTIHKAKGKEFDNVYLMLNNFQIREECRKRELYVAMTRAKNNLTVHLNNNILNGLNTDSHTLETDNTDYSMQETVVLQLTHKDVWLSFFDNVQIQNEMKKLRNGDSLRFSENNCYSSDNRKILSFSKAFVTKLEDLQNKGYAISEVKINFILFWKKEETDREIKIILPEVYLTKNN